MKAVMPILWCFIVVGWPVACWMVFLAFRVARVMELGRSLESALGFRQRSIHIPDDESLPHFKVVIKSVVKGGAFEQAGFRAGDILPELRGSVLQDSSQTALIELLIRNRGGTVELAAINIADLVDDGIPFAARQRRKIAIAVPPGGNFLRSFLCSSKSKTP